MHQPNKLKFPYHKNNFLFNYIRSSSIARISSIPVIASVQELYCHTVYIQIRTLYFRFIFTFHYYLSCPHGLYQNRGKAVKNTNALIRWIHNKSQ
jgi:hypothetical protein